MPDRERIIELAITAVAFAGIAALVLIVVFVGREALPLFLDAEAREEASLSRLLLPQTWRAGRPASFLWQPVGDVPKYALAPLFVGTLKVTAVAMAIAVPVALSAAVFATEFAPRLLREWLKPIVELLAAIPSVVLGAFALLVLASALRPIFGFTVRLNATVAGVGLALAVIPIVFTVAEDALTAVPRTLREASLALGATRWETAFRVVLPAAAPGILAACVLGFGRSIGETMLVLMASGNAAITSWSLGDSTRTLSATIAAEMGEVVVGSPHHGVLFLLGVLLFALTFMLNLVASVFVRRVSAREGGRA